MLLQALLACCLLVAATAVPLTKENGHVHVQRDRNRRQLPLPGVYFWEVSDVKCELADAERLRTERLCREELGLPKRPIDESNNGTGGSSLEFEMVLDQPLNATTLGGGQDDKKEEEPAKQSWWKRAWNSVKKGASKMWQGAKDLGAKVKTNVVNYFKSDAEKASENINKHMTVDYCIAKKLNLIDASGLPDVALVRNHVDVIVAPTGKPLSQVASVQFNDCIDKAIQTGKDESDKGNPELPCTGDFACRSNYRAGHCIKLALVEHCMAYGVRKENTTPKSTAKNANEPSRMSSAS